jgi:hypothetical protein
MSSESECQAARSWVDVGSFHARLFGVVYFAIISVREFPDTPSYASIIISDDNLVLLTGPNNAIPQRGTGHFTLHNSVFPSEAKCTLILCENNCNWSLGAKSWPVSKASDISAFFRRPRSKITKILFQIHPLFCPTLITGNQFPFTVGRWTSWFKRHKDVRFCNCQSRGLIKRTCGVITTNTAPFNIQKLHLLHTHTHTHTVYFFDIYVLQNKQRLYLGAFAKLRKATLASCPSVRPHGTTRLPLDGF